MTLAVCNKACNYISINQSSSQLHWFTAVTVAGSDSPLISNYS